MDKECLICGKEVDEKICIPLQIAYNIPGKHLYMATSIYCKECNDAVVLPAIQEISDKLKLNYTR